jgi:hypothetical protein
MDVVGLFQVEAILFLSFQPLSDLIFSNIPSSSPTTAQRGENDPNTENVTLNFKKVSVS